jgi:hypothetical protein
MNQLQLTYEPLQPPRNLPTARHSDPETSREAGTEKLHWSEHRKLALAALVRAGDEGATDFALAAATGVAQTSIGCRRKDLRNMGFVEDSGIKRPSPSGSPSIVWRVTRAGRDAYHQLTINQNMNT